jgi:flotillin
MTQSELPTWGMVTAQPHEFLIQIRKGKVRRALQGGSCWRWPGDTIARVDTSVRRLQFTADQVTREKVGVAVTGLAVFRIVEPLLAYRTLDLGQGEGYAEILREMFVGATRRLVANLGLEECLTRRKDALAVELMEEVAPVVEGDGRADDGTDRGWGIAIDTIEIQDVKILSEEVFSNLQAPYRESLEMEALKARAEVEAEQQRIAVEQARTAELARQSQMELERDRLGTEAERRRQATRNGAELARLDLDAHIARSEAEAASRVRVAEQEAEAERLVGQARADVVAMDRRAHAEPVSAERMQEMLLAETLPRMAEAFADSFGQIVVTGGGGGMEVLGQGVAQVLATAKAFGFELPGPRDVIGDSEG